MLFKVTGFLPKQNQICSFFNYIPPSTFEVTKSNYDVIHKMTHRLCRFYFSPKAKSNVFNLFVMLIIPITIKDYSIRIIMMRNYHLK